MFAVLFLVHKPVDDPSLVESALGAGLGKETATLFCIIMLSKFGDIRKLRYLCIENKKYSYDTKKKKIILTLLGIAYVSAFVMIWGLFIHLSIWGVLAAAVCIISFAIALMLGVPIDSKGFPSDDGLQPKLWIDSLHQRFEPLPILRSDWHWARLFVSAR